MTKVILSGCDGKMGKILVELIRESDEMLVIAGVDKSGDEGNYSFPVFQSFDEMDMHADVIIDFSHESLLSSLLEYVERTQTPVVIGTTGLDKKELGRIQRLSQNIPIFQSANTSLGIHLLVDMVKKAAHILQDSFDVEVVEKHHNSKLDAPSGTAYMIAGEINQALGSHYRFRYGRHGNPVQRQEHEIGIHAIRGGNLVGEHSVLFAGIDETLEVKHTITSRRVFALGAIKAAQFLITQQPGLYSMQDILS